MNDSSPRQVSEDDPPRITIELANRCNLHCRYCLRDDDALHHSPAHFFPLALLRRIVQEARAVCGASYVSFTGGEPTLHPRFDDVLAMIEAESLQCGFVTNGWNFDRVRSAVLRHRAAVRVVAFSLDGATAEAHDCWRGRGSFARVMQAMAQCHFQGIPFIAKAGIRRDTLPQLEQIALLAARLGASALHFSHLLPTSEEVEAELALTFAERRQAEQEIAILGKVLKMPVGVSVGYLNVDPSPPCSVLRGASCNVDYRGRLTLCCNLAGYRGSAENDDIVADLTRENFATAWTRLRLLAEEQVERRKAALAAQSSNGEVDLYTGSPCLFCLQSFGKIPWRTQTKSARELPVLTGFQSAAADGNSAARLTIGD